MVALVEKENVCAIEGDCIQGLFALHSWQQPRVHTPLLSHASGRRRRRHRTPPGILSPAPSGPGPRLAIGPSILACLAPSCQSACLMSAYEQTRDCQVAVHPCHGDRVGYCHRRAIKGGPWISKVTKP